MNGHIPFDVAELGVIADLTAVRVADLIPEGPAVRHQGLEPRTRWLSAKGVAA